MSGGKSSDRSPPTDPRSQNVHSHQYGGEAAAKGVAYTRGGGGGHPDHLTFTPSETAPSGRQTQWPEEPHSPPPPPPPPSPPNIARFSREGTLRRLKGSAMHLQTFHSTSRAPEGSTNALRSGYGLKYGCFGTPDGPISTADAPPTRAFLHSAFLHGAGTAPSSKSAVSQRSHDHPEHPPPPGGATSTGQKQQI